MTFKDKMIRMVEESGWSYSEVARRIGRDSPQQVLRWAGKVGSGRPPKPGDDTNKDGSARKPREKQSPGRIDLIRISELFGVDIRWLIDDELEWDDRLKADNPILVQIRRLPMEDQLAMWTWHSSRGKDDTQPGSSSHPKEKPPSRPTRNDGGRTNRGMNALGG